MIPGREAICSAGRCSPAVNTSFQSNNYTDELKATGLKSAGRHQAQLRFQSVARRPRSCTTRSGFTLSPVRGESELCGRCRGQPQRRQSQRVDYVPDDR